MSRDLAAAATDYRAARQGVAEALQRRLLGLALDAEGQAKRNATERPRVRSGALRRSITGRAEIGLDAATLTLTAGEDGTSTGRYASLQEYGGVVRAIRSQYLAIPVGPAKTAAGVARYASPRDVPGLFFRPTAAGGLLLRGRKRGPPELLYVLRRQVTIPAARYIGRALDWARAEAPRRVDGVLADALPSSKAGG